MSEHQYTFVSQNAQALIDAVPFSEERFKIKRIFQGNGGKLIRLSFLSGQIMREHSANAPIFVQVLEGQIAFRVAGDEIMMSAGAIIHVETSVQHELEALSDAHVLLTLCT